MKNPEEKREFPLVNEMGTQKVSRLMLTTGIPLMLSLHNAGKRNTGGAADGTGPVDLHPGICCTGGASMIEF